MDNKGKPKHLLIAGLIVAGIYLYPTIYRLVFATRVSPRAPAAAAPAPAAPKTTPTNPAPPLPILGTWAANGLVPNRGNCTIQLELTSNPTPPDQYSGYVTLRCIPAFVPGFGKSMKQVTHTMNEYTPVSSELEGSLQAKSVQLHLSKSIGTLCPVTALTLTPFGTTRLAVEWEDSCGDGQLIMRKIK